MRGNLKRGALLTALLAASAAAGCAQDIGDIDRTEPNRIRKADLLQGSWWMHQKIIEVPGSARLEVFEGLMNETQKVVFVAEENYLMAYRSYPTLPGADDQNLEVDGLINYEEIYGENYKGDVLAMFPITSHFDVQRQYDPSTGEQSNVISENTSDRPWYERDYMRVRWQDNPIVNLELTYVYETEYELGRQASIGQGDERNEPYFEYDANGQLVYFDAPATYVINPSFWDILYYYYNYTWSDMYAATEVRVATSFAKDLGDADAANIYEPLEYTNQDMNRFGYFRTERYTYDPKLGFMNSGRIELANRHNIWLNSYTVDGAGNKVFTPIEQRVVRTIPYYIFDGVKEEKLAKMSEQVIDEWNVAFKRAVYIMQHPNNTVLMHPQLNTPYDGMQFDLVTTIDYNILKGLLGNETNVFAVCHIPVRPDDNPVCGNENNPGATAPNAGYSPREGDFRKNFLWLVNQRQDVGLLGYCPSSTDPLTGRTISAQAHVYTAPMNEIASILVDKLKFAKGVLTPEGVRANDAAIETARHSRERFVELSKMSDKVRSARLNSAAKQMQRSEKRLERKNKIQNLRKFDYVAVDNKIKKMIDDGLLTSDMESRVRNNIMKRSGKANLSDEVLNETSLANIMSYKTMMMSEEIEKALGAKGFCFKNDTASYDIKYTALMDKYKDRDDYDNIFYEIRADVFRATALHEMGHGFGLRHNHTGSYDSMNYFDGYWNLRGKYDHSLDQAFWKDGTLKTVGDIYALYDYSDAQLRGGLLGYQYSSIMDYSSGYTDDNQGLGKYDHAAILYAYSAGTTSGSQANHSNGLVEVFSDSSGNVAGDQLKSELGTLAYNILTHADTTKTSRFDDQTSVGQPYLELVHFRDFFSSMGDYDFIHNRKVVRLDNYLANQDLMVRVPYLFCTDDNRGALRSCHVFDHGADYIEQFNDVLRDYRTNYWFRDFARGRAWWSSDAASWGYGRDFFKLSDFFQSWYVGDRNTLDDVLGEYANLIDDTGEIAAAASFNLFAEALATPEYGLYCKRKDTGELFGLSSDGDARQETSEFYRRSRCGGDDAEYFYVRQGEGRRRFQKYDVNAGFDWSQYELELQHNDTSYYAIRALFDNSATIIADSGDMGTYTLGLYDYFTEESIALTNAMMAEEYSIHSPVLVTDDGNGGTETETYNGDETITGTLKYPALAKVRYYSAENEKDEIEFNPLTGETVEMFNKYAGVGSVPLFGACDDDSQCALLEGASEMYCGLNDPEVVCSDEKAAKKHCWAIFDNVDYVKCPAGSRVVSFDSMYACDNSKLYTCVPDSVSNADYNYYANELQYSSEVNALQADSDKCIAAVDKWNNLLDRSVSACSATNFAGSCGEGKTCIDGKCTSIAYRVQMDPSLSQKFYMIIFGTLLTGPVGMDPTFYDQFNLYRKGSGQENTPSSGYRAVSFENPYTGEIFAANEREEATTSDDYIAQFHKYATTCNPEDKPVLSAWNYSNNRLFADSGSAMMIRKANALKDEVDKYWATVIRYQDYVNWDNADYEKTEEFQKYLNAYYTWAMKKYDLQYIIRDINLVRNVYDYFGTVW